MKKIQITPGFYLLTGVLFLWNPPWQVALLFSAAAIHEMGHLAAARLIGGRFDHIRLGFFGWEMDLGREALSYRREIALDLAGPLANALACVATLLFIRRSLTEMRLFFFFCNALYGAFQLLPAADLDGGRALTAFFSLFLSRDRAEGVMRLLTGLTAVFLLWAGCLVFQETKNPTLLFFLPGVKLGKRKKDALFYRA